MTTDPSKFMNELLHGESRRLARTFRFNSTPVLRTENVAEHSWYVAYIGMHLWTLCGRQGIHLDLGDILAKCILHDLDEALTGDIPRPFKYHTPKIRELLEDASNEIFTDYVDSTAFPVELVDYWRDAKMDATGLVVKMADLVSVVSYATEEVRMGNALLKCKLGEVTRYMRELHEIMQGHAKLRVSVYDGVCFVLLPYLTATIKMADTEFNG